MTELERLARIEQWREDFVKYLDERLDRIESKLDKTNGNGKELFKLGKKSVTSSQVWVMWNRFIIFAMTALLAYLGISGK